MQQVLRQQLPSCLPLQLQTEHVRIGFEKLYVGIMQLPTAILIAVRNPDCKFQNKQQRQQLQQ